MELTNRQNLNGEDHFSKSDGFGLWKDIFYPFNSLKSFSPSPWKNSKTKLMKRHHASNSLVTPLHPETHSKNDRFGLEG